MVGLDTYEDGVGYQHIKIEPHIGGNFTFASADLKTYYGLLSAGWKLKDNAILVDAVIPPNTHATVILPANSRNDITENGKALTDDIKSVITGNNIQIEIGSGTYQFEVKKK
jgi:alpha-L-rhamnosidase